MDSLALYFFYSLFSTEPLRRREGKKEVLNIERIKRDKTGRCPFGA
jgi:hypothetical protein